MLVIASASKNTVSECITALQQIIFDMPIS
jgi:hypothetical protein